MDGTLIDSTPGVIAAWQIWSTKYQLGDFTQIIHDAHGRRLQDSLKEYCGIADEKHLAVCVFNYMPHVDHINTARTKSFSSRRKSFVVGQLHYLVLRNLFISFVRIPKAK